MEYNFPEIEKKWRQFWAENQTFKAEDNSSKEKYYVLDMFPYPSGAGLHVGHPLGYIASDIFARYKRLQGYNVLHPMGYDSFGLPAEQYAIQTGQHPEKTTKENIARYREQLDKIGFSFDWSREIRTSNADYYKWTQWIFIKLFHAWYNPSTNKAESIQTLIETFETLGFGGNATDPLTGGIEYPIDAFSPADWKAFEESKKRQILMHFRLAYLDNTWVNWCPALGTVLANDEVINGLSERGGHPVERKKMQQWSLRITAYAERLLTGLDKLDWTESIKDMQRNWIGKSKGALIRFKLDEAVTPLDLPSRGENTSIEIEVFTTRPDTIFGVSYVTLAPEHELVDKITTEAQKEKVAAYVTYAKNRTERERQAEVKNITGEFTGAYVIHPFTNEKIPVWIGDYVLAGYGTGAVMAVPAHDERDFRFAKHFDLPRPQVIEAPEWDFENDAYGEKSGTLIQSSFLNGLDVKTAISTAIEEIEKAGVGLGKINFRLRDAVFGRQRYWGEPIPIYYKNGHPYTMDEQDLPLELPEVDKFLPTEDGEPPLARATDWKYRNEFEYEKTTMPGWAGSSWYYLRYMDPANDGEFVSKEKADYWKNVDLYIGGSEHATGHLLYSRFWCKFLYDLGYISFDEPFQKMINQGMILGRSSFVYVVSTNSLYKTNSTKDKLAESMQSLVPSVVVSKTKYDKFNLLSKKDKLTAEEQIDLSKIKNEIITCLSELENQINLNSDSQIEITFNNLIYPVHIDIALVDNDRLDIDRFRNWRDDLKETVFICEEDGSFLCGHEIEKMSKSKYNVQTPDELIEKFGADTLRMYEMFLGPLEQTKPWDTKGINGVSNFVRKTYRLFVQEEKSVISDAAPGKESLKTIHKTIKKIGEDLERFSFNTCISTLMICVNELTEQKCHSREVLTDLVKLLAPFAPFIAEELWEKLGNEAGTISAAGFPVFNESHLIEANVMYPISFNGKVRFNLEFPKDMSREEVEKNVMAHENTAKYLEGNAPKKVIVVPGKIVNVVV